MGREAAERLDELVSRAASDAGRAEALASALAGARHGGAAPDYIAACVLNLGALRRKAGIRELAEAACGTEEEDVAWFARVHGHPASVPASRFMEKPPLVRAAGRMWACMTLRSLASWGVPA